MEHVSAARLRELVAASQDELRDAAPSFQQVLGSLERLDASLDDGGDDDSLRAARDAFLHFPQLQPQRGRKPSDELRATRELVEILNHLVLLGKDAP